MASDRAVGWTLAAVAVALGSWFVATGAGSSGTTTDAAVALVLPAVSLQAALGLVVVSRAVTPATGRRLGWILLLGAVATAGGAWVWPTLDASVVPAAGLQPWATGVGVACLVTFVALFPHGITGGVRGAVAVTVLLGAGSVAAGLALDLARVVTVAGGTILGLAIAVSLAMAGRKALTGSGPGLGQAAWVVGSASLASVSVLSALAIDEPAFWLVAGATTGVGLPVGIAIAIIRNRAFGIYRFIGFRADHRIWSLVNVGLGAGLAFVVAWRAVAWLDAGPALTVLLSLGLGGAALPLIVRRQTVIDARYGQRGADPAEHLERFAGGIREEDRPKLRGPVFDLLSGFSSAAIVDGEAGMRFAVATADREIGRHTFVHGSYDLEPMQRAISALSEHTGAEGPLRGKVVVDVGANVGTSVVPFIALFDAQRVIAVEPAPENLELLRWTITLNRMEDRVRVIAAAASDRTGVLPLEMRDDNWGDHRLLADPAGRREARHRVIEVPVMRLDDILARESVAPHQVCLAWIDVQGHEGQALLGAEGLFRAGVPLAVEIWPDELERSGGLTALLSIAAAHYEGFVDLRDPRSNPRPVAELPVVVASLRGSSRFTDILLLR